MPARGFCQPFAPSATLVYNDWKFCSESSARECETMSLELNKLTGQVEAMGEQLAARRQDHDQRAEQARDLLRTHAAVTDELLAKIAEAKKSDEWRRGATPLGDSLNGRHQPATPYQPATLIAADGSQIYPDR